MTTSQPFDAHRREELIDAYVSWVEKHDEASEWAWEVLHDAIWWKGDPLSMLETIVAIVDRLNGDNPALLEVGAGPLEDVLGGDPAVMAEAERLAQSDPAFRIAVGNVDGVKHREPGYERLRAVLGSSSTDDRSP